MQAIHLVTRLNVGGIARYLDVARDAVDLLVSGRVTVRGETEAPWTGPRIGLAGLQRAVRPVDDARALAGLVRLLRRRNPGVLHTHASKAGLLGRLAARMLHIPAVHTFHGHVLDGYFPAPVSRAITRIEGWLGRRSVLTATGPATARELEARLQLPVRVLPPGIELPDPAAGARERWRAAWGSPELVALAVGRDAPVKQLPRFVAAARCAGFLPVVAGATRVGGALAVGPVARIEELYAAADVVVSASKREGTPFSLLEAAWCGRPVAATPVGDVAWVVGEGGLVTPDLEGALKELRDPGLRLELGARAARQVRERFPAAAVAPRLRQLYESL